MIETIILIVSSFFTAIISAVAGMAGGIVLLSIMTFFLNFQVIVPIHGCVQLLSNSSRCWFLRKSIYWDIFFPFLIGLPFGTILAVKLIKSLPSKEYFLLAICALIFYTLFKPKKLPSLVIPKWSFSIIGFVVGLLGPIIGATGPLMAPFFLRPDMTKENVVATKSSVQTIGHLAKIPAFIALDFPYMDYITLILLMGIASIIGTKAGVLILGKVEEKVFRYIYKSALFIAALRILYKIYEA